MVVVLSDTILKVTFICQAIMSGSIVDFEYRILHTHLLQCEKSTFFLCDQCQMNPVVNWPLADTLNSNIVHRDYHFRHSNSVYSVCDSL